MAERDAFSFEDIIQSTATLDASDLDSFLSSDPDDVRPVEKKNPPAKTDPKGAPKEDIKEQPKEQPKSQINGDDLFGQLEGEDESEEDKNEGKENEGEETKNEEDKVEGKKDTNIYSDFAEELFKLGALTPDEDEDGNEVIPEIKTAEAFLDAIRNEGKKQAETTLEKFLSHNGPEYREAFDQIFVNGIDPYEYYTRQSKIENIENLDISTEENQERLVRQLYREQGRTQESIDNKLTRLKNYGELEEEAKEAKTILAQKEAKELQEIGIKKQRDLQRKAQIKNEYVSSINKILDDKIKEKQFDGIPIDRKTAEQLSSYLTREKYETPDKQTLTEFDKDLLDLSRPENHSTRVKIALLLQILKKDPTLSSIGKRAITKESNRLFQNIEKTYGKKTTGVKDTKVVADSNSDW